MIAALLLDLLSSSKETIIRDYMVLLGDKAASTRFVNDWSFSFTMLSNVADTTPRVPQGFPGVPLTPDAV